MLHCKSQYAAMQANAWRWHLACLAHFSLSQQGNKMSKSASIGLARPATFFGRVMAAIDRLLMANANIAVRNGDLPYFGL
jgi:hypothetical protein